MKFKVGDRLRFKEVPALANKNRTFIIFEIKKPYYYVEQEDPPTMKAQWQIYNIDRLCYKVHDNNDILKGML